MVSGMYEREDVPHMAIDDEEYSLQSLFFTLSFLAFLFFLRQRGFVVIVY
jgi:hypothetical protein